MRRSHGVRVIALLAFIYIGWLFTHMTAPRQHSNRLIREKSPYLLQHAHNPVDWYPWGPEALGRAAREDKPIFLSIGYSTCYWCHVMERESFEDPEIARLLNDSFVAIKVDREERPDLDALYMSAVQALSGQGGWPMSVFVTPEGKPFFGGTYFPPHDQWGRPGFDKILRSIAAAWRTKHAQLLASGQSLTDALQSAPAEPGSLTLQTLTQAAQQIGSQYDPIHGGFGPAPKFPRPHALSLLLRAWSRHPDPAVLDMVEVTLRAMARGGIHDQLGGGFHRYSTDERWLVPHFEKMLYDQALLARTYLETFQATGRAEYAEVARDIFTYVLRDLRAPEGAFYSAEDAGEVGKEGELYVWSPREVAAVLGEAEAAAFNAIYDVTDEGNFEGHSVLHVARPAQDARLAEMRSKLLAARSARRRPHRDDKILTDWNGLMIGALAYGGRALGQAEYTAAAKAAAGFLLSHLQLDGRLLHRYRDGEARIEAFLDDYAFFGWGLLELYEATGEPQWLREAIRLTRRMLEDFWDPQGGGFFLSGRHNEPLIAKTKELYDGAVPSGNSAAALVVARLALLTGDQEFERAAERMMQAFASTVNQGPHAFPQFLIALDAWLGPSMEIVLAGDPGDSALQEMIRRAQRRFLPRAVLVIHPSHGPAATEIESLLPFVAAQRPLDGRATAYVCEHRACRLPTIDPDQLERLLSEHALK